jgi:SAM-dependent methyltransferase
LLTYSTEELMDAKQHWENVYETKGADAVSWYQARPGLSLDLIRHAAPDSAGPVIDVGGGASVLVDGLLDAGYDDVTVLDISEAALDVARRRLDARSDGVRWIAEDVLTAPLPESHFAVWHDRAVFHFLTDPADRARYVERVRHAVRPEGLVLIATFAPDGPARCSGLEVARYAPEALHHEFGEGFELLESHREAHQTPGGAVQLFTYCLCRWEGIGAGASR